MRRVGQIADRAAFEKARNVVAQVGGGLISPFRLFAQRLHDDVVEVAGERAAD